MLWELLFLLLPISAATGWVLGWRSAKKSDNSSGSTVSPEYYKGLNFLLNEQPDEAAEVFLKVLNIDDESIEVHHALATLFLKRGEFDRAIRIHQNLIARPTLSREQRHEALFYLANDYFRAGVLDRAEALFIELQNTGSYSQQSLDTLLNIYQQQQDWDKAVDIAIRLQKMKRGGYEVAIANYYCEIAEALPANSPAQLKAIRNALSSDRHCARANYIKGRVLMGLGRYTNALKVFAKVESQDATLLGEVLPLMIRCWEGVGRIDDAFKYLCDVVARYRDPALFHYYAEFIRQYRLNEECRNQLAQHLKGHSSLSGVVQLLHVDCDLSDDAYRHEIYSLLEPLADRAANYHCGQCGFKGHSFHWQCPGCQSWNSVRRTVAAH